MIEKNFFTKQPSAGHIISLFLKRCRFIVSLSHLVFQAVEFLIHSNAKRRSSIRLSFSLWGQSNSTVIHSSGKKRFMLDAMTRPNASNFAIFYIPKNPKLHFSFYFVVFSSNECPGVYGHSLKNKSK